MRYGSVCSGVEAATLAWHQMGWKCVFVSEVEPFPCAVLQERFGATAPINPLDPAESSNEDDRKMRESWIKQNEFLKIEGVLPNEGDFTKIGKKYENKIDLLVGGTPCQDLSIAGKRAGFDGERSSLALDFVRLAYESKCKWFVWENVPGVFSSNEGRDFATLLSLFTGTEVGVPKKGWGTAGFVCNARRDRYGVAWRTLDGQFTRASGFPFAVPQRRRRVFLVGYFGDWSRAAEVLLEPGRLCWNTPARFKARERFAEIAGANINLAERPLCGAESNRGESNGVDAFNQAVTGDVSKTLNSAASDTDHTPCVIEKREQDSVFWNGNDCAEALTCTSDRQLMPDKARLQCVIERNEVAATLTTAYADKMGIENQHVDQGCPNFVISAYNGAGDKSVVQTLKIRSGKEGSGKGALIQDDLSATLGCGNDQTLFVVHGAQTPINNTEHANSLGCCNGGLENCICKSEVISLNNKQFGQCEENIASALLATDYKEPQVVCYENHANDSRITESKEVSPLISSRAGTGGGNLPLIQEYFNWHSQALTASPITDDVAPTIPAAMGMGGTSMTTPMFTVECYAIDSVSSNSMKSANPNSGFHKEEIAKTLDTTNPNPIKNQGGNVIVDAVAIAENIIGRADHNGGNGVGAQEEIAYTQNATGVMGVCTSTVRRLLPIECERLMGFPDDWTKIPWKGKSVEDCPDSPRYKACGNSMCVNVMRWIGEQIQKVENKYNG